MTEAEIREVAAGMTPRQKGALLFVASPRWNPELFHTESELWNAGDYRGCASGSVLEALARRGCAEMARVPQRAWRLTPLGRLVAKAIAEKSE